MSAPATRQDSAGTALLDLRTGWRLWLVHQGWLHSPMLRAEAREGRWLPRREYVAQCHEERDLDTLTTWARTEGRHDAPGEVCGCGLRATDEPWRLSTGLAPGCYGPDTVVGLVELDGPVREGSWVFDDPPGTIRAARMRLAGPLFAPVRHARRLGRLYGVETIPVQGVGHDVIAAAEDWDLS